MLASTGLSDHDRRARRSARLADLPDEIKRERVLRTAETCALVDMSPSRWRTLVRLGEAPAPVQLGTRAIGWRFSVLLEWLKSREAISA